MKLEYLLITLLVGCSTAPEVKPIAAKPNDPIRRVSATKSDLLYNYTIGEDYSGTFDMVEADANAWCQKKYKMSAVQRTQSQCGIYADVDNRNAVCTVAFKCQ